MYRGSLVALILVVGFSPLLAGESRSPINDFKKEADGGLIAECDSVPLRLQEMEISGDSTYAQIVFLVERLHPEMEKIMNTLGWQKTIESSMGQKEMGGGYRVYLIWEQKCWLGVGNRYIAEESGIKVRYELIFLTTDDKGHAIIVPSSFHYYYKRGKIQVYPAVVIEMEADPTDPCFKKTMNPAELIRLIKTGKEFYVDILVYETTVRMEW